MTTPEGLTVFIDFGKSDLGETPPELEEVARHLCGLVLPGESFIASGLFTDAARECYARARRADSTGRAALTLVAYVSSYYHELRHVHDLIATTYGQDILFRSLNCSQNFGLLINALTEWQSKSAGRRVPFPVGLAPGLLAELPSEVGQVVRHYTDARADATKFEAPRHASPAGLTVTHLLEASAVDIQLGFIRAVFGEDALFDFERFIRGGSRANIYLQIRSEFAERLGVRGPDVWDLGPPLSVLLWCSLMGTTFPGKRYDDGPTSVVFFEALMEHVFQNSTSLSIPAIRAAVDAFCGRWGFLSPGEMIARRCGELAARAERFRAAVSERGLEEEADLADVYAALARAFEHLAELIEGEPDAYFHPVRYVSSYAEGRLPSVLVRCRAAAGGHDFITRGREVVSPAQWNLVSSLTMMFGVLVGGRGQYPAYLEDIYWRMLTERRQGGTALRFQDCSPLFGW